MANLIVSAIATWNGKALNKGKTDIASFNKSVTTLGKTFAAAFSAAAILSFSKKAIKAFAADEAAAKSLQLQLINTGNAFAVADVESYIKSLEKTYAILTDLRGPFKTLLNATGSVEVSQRLLEAALNTSAGTGETLDTVIAALTSGLRGQTKGIKSLNTGIDANILASGDMNKILIEIEKRFKGQAAARLDTYSGKIDQLTLGSKLATKAIGEGLVDALLILSADRSIENLSKDFENLGKNIGTAVVEMAKLIKKVSDLVSNPSFKAAILGLAILSKNPSAVVGAMGLIGLDAVGGALTKDYSKPLSYEENAAIGRKRLADRVKAGKIQIDLNKYNAAALAILKAKSEVDKLKDKFDLERIGLMVALNAATDEETKKRIEAKIAILDNNEALAKKINAELDAAKKAKDLADAFGGAATSMVTNNARLQAFISSITDKINAKTAAGEYNPTGVNLPGVNQLFPSAQGPLGNIDYTVPIGSGIPAYGGGSGTPMSYADVRITVDTANSGDLFNQLVANSLMVSTRNGYSTVPTGQP